MKAFLCWVLGHSWLYRVPTNAGPVHRCERCGIEIDA